MLKSTKQILKYRMVTKLCCDRCGAEMEKKMSMRSTDCFFTLEHYYSCPNCHGVTKTNTLYTHVEEVWEDVE